MTTLTQRILAVLLTFSVAAVAAAQPDPNADPKKAAKKYGKLVQKDPENPDGWYNLGFAQALLANWAEAVPAASKAVELGPESAEYRYVLGFALNGAGRADEAVASLEKAVELDPGLGKAHALLAKAYSAAGRHDDAIRAIKGSLKTKPPNASELYVDLGNAYLAQGDTASAVKWFKKSTENEPNSSIAWFNLGVVLRRLSMKEGELLPDSADAFARAAELAPKDADSLFLAGLTAFMAERPDSARTFLEKFLRVEPSSGRSKDAEVYLAELAK